MSDCFRILIDYGAYEGMKFLNETRYQTVDAAVKDALEAHYGTPFLIVTVIDWRAEHRSPQVRDESGNVQKEIDT